MKKKLNLENPQDLNEKIQWLIVNKYGKEEAKYTDKIAVREYIEKMGYKNLLTELYGTYDSFSKINFDKLPEKFVLKTNHDCGSAVICLNKNLFDRKKAKVKLNKSLKRNFAKVSLEYHYKYIKPQIMCEEYIDDGNGKNPIDYKFFCFNGQPDCILVCTNRESILKIDYYDLEWNYLDYAKDDYKSGNILEKPKNLDEMIKIARKLSLPFQFVRVDLYNCNGKIYFGELTFTSASGLAKYCNDSGLKHLGNLIKIT